MIRWSVVVQGPRKIEGIRRSEENARASRTCSVSSRRLQKRSRQLCINGSIKGLGLKGSTDLIAKQDARRSYQVCQLC